MTTLDDLCRERIARLESHRGTTLERSDNAELQAVYEVARALEHFIENYDDFAHHPEFRAVVTKRDHLEAVLRKGEKA